MEAEAAEAQAEAAEAQAAEAAEAQAAEAEDGHQSVGLYKVKSKIHHNLNNISTYHFLGAETNHMFAHPLRLYSQTCYAQGSRVSDASTNQSQLSLGGHIDESPGDEGMNGVDVRIATRSHPLLIVV